MSDTLTIRAASTSARPRSSSASSTGSNPYPETSQPVSEDFIERSRQRGTALYATSILEPVLFPNTFDATSRWLPWTAIPHTQEAYQTLLRLPSPMNWHCLWIWYWQAQRLSSWIAVDERDQSPIPDEYQPRYYRSRGRDHAFVYPSPTAGCDCEQCDAAFEERQRHEYMRAMADRMFGPSRPPQHEQEEEEEEEEEDPIQPQPVLLRHTSRAVHNTHQQPAPGDDDVPSLTSNDESPRNSIATDHGNVVGQVAVVAVADTTSSEQAQQVVWSGERREPNTTRRVEVDEQLDDEERREVGRTIGVGLWQTMQESAWWGNVRSERGDDMAVVAESSSGHDREEAEGSRHEEETRVAEVRRTLWQSKI